MWRRSRVRVRNGVRVIRGSRRVQAVEPWHAVAEGAEWQAAVCRATRVMKGGAAVRVSANQAPSQGVSRVQCPAEFARRKNRYAQ